MLYRKLTIRDLDFWSSRSTRRNFTMKRDNRRLITRSDRESCGIFGFLPLYLPLPRHASPRRNEIPPRLHRLDARTGLRPHVSDALLRLLARRTGAPEPLLYVLPTR